MFREGCFEKMMSKLSSRRQGGTSLTSAGEVFRGLGNHWHSPHGRTPSFFTISYISNIFLYFPLRAHSSPRVILFTCGSISFVFTSPLTMKIKGAEGQVCFVHYHNHRIQKQYLAQKYLLNEWMNHCSVNAIPKPHSLALDAWQGGDWEPEHSAHLLCGEHLSLDQKRLPCFIHLRPVLSSSHVPELSHINPNG